MALRAGDDADRRRGVRPSRRDVLPARVQDVERAAASAVTWAIWQPVTNPNDADCGMASSSFSHPPATSSTTEAAGPAA